MTGHVAQAFSRSILHLIILPTEKCNFRCTYCYEDFEIGKMSRETVEAIKRHIDARLDRGVEHLVLSWFGGEPLLASDVIEDLCNHAQARQADGRLHSFRGDITTNAYLLTPANLKRMVGLGQSEFQVSLDGFGAGHDQTRRYISGKGTFETVWANLLAARDSDLDFKITLRCHLTSANSESIAHLVDAISQEFAGDRRFSVFFKTIENLGGPNAASIHKMSVAQAKALTAGLQTKLAAAGLGVSAVLEGPESNTGLGKDAGVGAGTQLQAAEATLAPRTPGKYDFDGYICYASKPNSLMIRADGRIGKCTVLMHDERNTVGRLNPDGSLTLDGALINQVWMRGFVSMDAGELGCPAMGMPKAAPQPRVLKLAELA